jgi:hypothetical protein
MTTDWTIKIEGVDELAKFFDTREKAINEALKKELLWTALNIERRAKELAPVDESHLIKEIKHTIEDNGLTARVGVGAGSQISEQMRIYAEVMEAGRTPGATAPRSEWLEGWVKRKGIETDEKRIPGMAFIVARSIGKKGIRGRRYFGTAWLEYGEGFNDRAVKVIWQAINQ